MILLISRIWCVVSSGFATRRIRNVLASVWVDFWAPRTKGDRDGGHFLFSGWINSSPLLFFLIVERRPGML